MGIEPMAAVVGTVKADCHLAATPIRREHSTILGGLTSQSRRYSHSLTVTAAYSRVASFHLIQPTRQRSLVPEQMLKTNQLFQEY